MADSSWGGGRTPSHHSARVTGSSARDSAPEIRNSSSLSRSPSNKRIRVSLLAGTANGQVANRWSSTYTPAPRGTWSVRA